MKINVKVDAVSAKMLLWVIKNPKQHIKNIKNGMEMKKIFKNLK